MKHFVAAFFIGIISTVNIILFGYVISCFWLWFIVPLLPLDEISVINAVALLIFASIFKLFFGFSEHKNFFQNGIKDLVDKEYLEEVSAVCAGIFQTFMVLFYLLIGFLIK